VLSSNGNLAYNPRELSYALPSDLGTDGRSFSVRYGPSGATGTTGLTGPTGTTGSTGPVGTGGTGT